MSNELKNELGRELALHTMLEVSRVLELLERPKSAQHGDLAFPCFQLAKAWGVNPPAAASRLKDLVTLPEGFSECSVAGPFVNFRFDRAQFVAATIRMISAPRKREVPPGKIIIEFSSPNIAKPFHVGHLRTTLIGNSLERIYRRLGYDVVTINHLGDWGTQFGFVWAGCKLWGKPSDPSVLELVELYRKATAIKDEQEKAIEAGKTFDGPDVTGIAREFFLDLEDRRPYALEFWEWCLEVSMRYLRAIYDRLNVSFDKFTGESFYSDKLERVRNELECAGILQESQGALGVDLGEELGFARIYTPDGRSLYLTRDLATAEYRAKTYNFTKALYIVGAPQTLHFKQIKGVLAALGREYAGKIIHVPFGHVLGMKTRGGGEFVELNDFLDEAYSRALESYRSEVEKRPEGLSEEAVAKAVALSAIVFSTLMRTRMKDVHFSWDEALKFQGDSGPYLLYAYARINGIRERAKGLLPAADPAPELFTEESAFELAVRLSDFEEILERVVEENEPAVLAAYALELSYAFSKAYNELKVIGVEEKLAAQRLSLFEATRSVLGEAITLLGLRLIERM